MSDAPLKPYLATSVTPRIIRAGIVVETMVPHVSMVVPVASASLQESLARAQVSMVIPVAAIDRIEFQLDAFLDVKGLHRRVGEIVVFVETTVFDVAKVLEDTVVLESLMGIETSKPFTDEFALADAFFPEVLFVRDASDSIDLSDQSHRDVGKGLSDAQAFVDVLNRSAQKRLSDVFAFNDTFRIGNGSTDGFVKHIANAVVVSDAPSNQLGKKHSDTVTLTDSRSLTFQNYADTTYFAEVYVGASYNF